MRQSPFTLDARQARGRGHGWRVVVVVLTLAALLAACGSNNKKSSSSNTSTTKAAGSADVLGKPNPAKGAPVKIGVITEGRSSTSDNTVGSKVAPVTVDYINKYKAGIGGRPIELHLCEAQGDPSKASDCATELIRANVVAAVISQTSVIVEGWRALHDAHIPTMIYGAFDNSLLGDTQSTFVLGSAFASLSDFPIAVAKKTGKKKISAVVIDVPAATGFFVGPAKGVFNKAGLDYALARIPPDQADATPQMQRIVSSGGSDQLVHVLGGGGFCIAVLNGLKAVGYTGPITLNQQCLDDSVRKAVGSYLKGVYVSANYPIGETSDPDVQLYEKAIVPKVPNAASDITGSGPPMFGTLMGLRTALEGLTGEVTPATITAKIKAMPWSHLPFGGGVHFRCNGQAVPTSPAICTRGALSVQLNDQGFPSASFQPFGDAQF